MSKQRLLPLDRVGAHVRITHDIIEGPDEDYPRHIVLSKGTICTLVRLSDRPAWPFYVLPLGGGQTVVGVTGAEFKYVRDESPPSNPARDAPGAGRGCGDPAGSYGYI